MSPNRSLWNQTYENTFNQCYQSWKTSSCKYYSISEMKNPYHVLHHRYYCYYQCYHQKYNCIKNHFLLTTCILLGNYHNSFGILYMLHQSALGDPPLIRTKNKNNLRFQNVCLTFISSELSIQNLHSKAKALPCHHHHMIICGVLGNLVSTICTI